PAGPRAHRPRRLPVRAAWTDRRRYPRADQRRGAAPADPPRVVRVLSRKGIPMRRAILAICATAVGLVLLLSFKTHTQSAAPVTSPAAASASAAPAASGSAAPASSTAAKSGASKTVTGAAWPTIYGPVQVRITVTGGKVTAVAATEYPEETPRDYQINSFAIPELNSEAL